jgi:glycine/D-amino acid oxidase-like deaminating enzyme
MDYTHIIAGGGIYGCYTALRLAHINPNARIAIAEREPRLFMRASYNNQARIHNGYHYPRSILTGLRSRINVPRFLNEFSEAIYTDFEQCYAIGRRRSNVTAGQFREFCRRIGAELRPAPKRIERLFEGDLIEAVFAVTEYAFDANKLRDKLWERLQASGISILFSTEVVKVTRGNGSSRSKLTVHLQNMRAEAAYTLSCGQLYNCTYSKLNTLLGRSGLRKIRLRHEATEMALVKVPPELEDLSVTVMCGPFFSLMPFPPRRLTTLSHVSYTPHYSWADEPGASSNSAHEPPFPLPSHFERMWRDAARYLPALRKAEHVDSLWEVKTILPQSDANDSRPILFKRDPFAPNVISLLGGKIDNIYDLDNLFSAMPNDRLESSLA